MINIIDDVKYIIYGYVYDLVLRDLNEKIEYIRRDNKCMYCFKLLKHCDFYCSKKCYNNIIISLEDLDNINYE